MSYLSVVDSKNPINFWRFDELAGTTIADLGSNADDGTYLETATLGLASAIETDASSRAVGGRAGTASSPAPVGSLSLGGWGYHDPDDPGWTTFGGIVSRNGQFGSNGSNFLGLRKIGSVLAMISFGSSDANTYTLEHPISEPGYYRGLVTRHLNVMRLYVNGVLVAQREDLPTGDISYSAYSTETWKFGHQGAGLWDALRTDEVDIYDYALSDADELEIYEAALLNPPIALRGDLHFNCYIDGDFAETPRLFPIRHDWNSPVRETLSWLTDVRASRQDYEQRAAVRQRPRRSLAFQALVMDAAERRRLHAYFFANQKKKIYLLVEMDARLLTADAAIGATSLSFGSEFYDFNDGGKIALFQDFENFEIVEADTVGDTSTTLAADTPTTQAWTANETLAIPVVRALIDRSTQIARITDEMEDAGTAFRILAEDVPLAPHRLGTYTPRYTYQDIEVFDPFILGANNWEEDGRGEVQIRAVDPESRAGIFSRDAQDTAPREITSYSFFLDGREEVAQFLAWWYSQKGRLKPIWIPTMQEDVVPISMVSDDFTVEGTDFSDFYLAHPARRDLAFIYKDETMTFRRIEGVTAELDEEEEPQPTGNEILDLDSGATLTNLWFVSLLKLSRLNEDTIELVWHTDDQVDVTLNFIDLLTTP